MGAPEPRRAEPLGALARARHTHTHTRARAFYAKLQLFKLKFQKALPDQFAIFLSELEQLGFELLDSLFKLTYVFFLSLATYSRRNPVPQNASLRLIFYVYFIIIVSTGHLAFY